VLAFAVGRLVRGEEEFLRYWEMGPGDLEAARQAALYLKEAFKVPGN